jgi:hypothetical protein
MPAFRWFKKGGSGHLDRCPLLARAVLNQPTITRSDLDASLYQLAAAPLMKKSVPPPAPM